MRFLSYGWYAYVNISPNEQVDYSGTEQNLVHFSCAVTRNRDADAQVSYKYTRTRVSRIEIQRDNIDLDAIRHTVQPLVEVCRP